MSAPYTQSYIVPDFDMQKYRRVAILPIANPTGNPFADLQVPDLLAEELVKRRFHVLLPADVMNKLSSSQLQDSVTENTSFADLGRWLDVDGIFTIVVGSYGYGTGKDEGFSIPYTTYQKVTTYGFIGDEYLRIDSNIPETKYLTVPDMDYNYATAEIMLSLYDGRDGELVFAILDVSSSRVRKLEDVARKLLVGEVWNIIGNKKIWRTEEQRKEEEEKERRGKYWPPTRH